MLLRLQLDLGKLSKITQPFSFYRYFLRFALNYQELFIHNKTIEKNVRF